MMSSDAPQPSYRADDLRTADTSSASLTTLAVLAGLLVPAILAYTFVTAGEVKVFAVILALLAAGVILARPFWGLLLFVGFVYTRPEDMLPALSGLQLALVISVVTLVGMWFQMFLRREKAVRSPIVPLMIGFGVMVVVSTAMGGDPLQAAQDVGKLVILVLLVLNLVRTPKSYRMYVSALIACSVYLAAFTIYQYFSGHAVEAFTGARAAAIGVVEGGVYSDPNDLAAVIAAGLALVFMRLPEARLLNRWLYAALAGLIIWGILLTGSRGGMLALLTATIGSVVLFSRRKTLAAPLAVLAAVLLLTVGSGRMTNFDNKEASANGRFWFWNNGIILLFRRPLTGVGYTQFPNYNGGRAAHNSFVIAFAETGLLGYFFWMGCIYYAYRRPPQERSELAIPASDTAGAQRDLLGARLALTTYLVAAFWINHTYYPVMYLLISLPSVQQIAAAERADLLLFKPAETFSDCLRIFLLCMASIGFIFLMIKLLG